MRKIGSRLAPALVVALVVSLALAGTAEAARHHHHRRNHHPAPASSPAPAPAAASPCVATPSTVALALSTPAFGDFSASVTCTGLVTGDAVTFTSPRLAGDCTSVTFNNVAPSVTVTADFAGRVSVTVHGVGCGSGAMSVQAFSFYLSVDVPITLTY